MSARWPTFRRTIKIIAVELEIPIIVLAQLNREAEKEKQPKLTHLRESGSLEQDADIVLFITPWKNPTPNRTPSP